MAPTPLLIEMGTICACSFKKKPKVKIHGEYVKQACLITSAAVFIVLRSKVSSSVNNVLHPLVSHETS